MSLNNSTAWELGILVNTSEIESSTLSPYFFTFSAVWLSFCAILGVTFNGVVLIVFFKDQKVCKCEILDDLDD